MTWASRAQPSISPSASDRQSARVSGEVAPWGHGVEAPQELFLPRESRDATLEQGDLALCGFELESTGSRPRRASRPSPHRPPNRVASARPRSGVSPSSRPAAPNRARGRGRIGASRGRRGRSLRGERRIVGAGGSGGRRGFEIGLGGGRDIGRALGCVVGRGRSGLLGRGRIGGRGGVLEIESATATSAAQPNTSSRLEAIQPIRMSPSSWSLAARRRARRDDPSPSNGSRRRSATTRPAARALRCTGRRRPRRTDRRSCSGPRRRARSAGSPR